MGNKQNKPTPTPMLKVESKSLSCFEEQERPRKGIPRRIGSILLTRWIDLKRREQTILEKARAAVTNGHAPPSILEEFEGQIKEEAKAHRLKYHPRVLANILVRKARPRPRPGLRVPKLTATAARRIHESFLRRDLERKRAEKEKAEKAKGDNDRTRSRISVRQQAWTDTMPRKMTGTTRSTQTISQPMPLSRDISLRSFRTGESGIGMSRASSMTSIASSKPRVIYTRERGNSLSEDREQISNQRERTDEREESRRERILEQRRKIYKQRRNGQKEGEHHGKSENVRKQTTAKENDTESVRNAGSRPEPGHAEEKLNGRRSSQQHQQGEVVVEENNDLLQSEERSREVQLDRQQGSRRRRRKLSISKGKAISYQEYWRRRVLLNRNLNKQKNVKDTAKLGSPKGSINQQEEVNTKSIQPSKNNEKERKGNLEKQDGPAMHESLTSTQIARMAASNDKQETDKGSESGSSNQRPPYSFSRNSRRFEDVADEIIHNGRLSRSSQRSLKKINKSRKDQSDTQRVSENRKPMIKSRDIEVHPGEHDASSHTKARYEDQNVQTHYEKQLSHPRPGPSRESRRHSTNSVIQSQNSQGFEENIYPLKDNQEVRRGSITHIVDHHHLPPHEPLHVGESVDRFREVARKISNQGYAKQALDISARHTDPPFVSEHTQPEHKAYKHTSHGIHGSQSRERTIHLEEQKLVQSKESYGQGRSQEYIRQSSQYEDNHHSDPTATHHPYDERTSNLSGNGQQLQLARIVPIVDQGRMIESQPGSHNTQLHNSREERTLERPVASQSQGRNEPYFVQDYRSGTEGRAFKYISTEYRETEQPREYDHGGRVESYRNDVVYVDRGPVTVYEGRLLQPLQQGIVEMRDGTGTRRWRKVSVVDVWELGEWERLRRSEEALVRSRSSATTVPRAL